MLRNVLFLHYKTGATWGGCIFIVYQNYLEIIDVLVTVYFFWGGTPGIIADHEIHYLLSAVLEMIGTKMNIIIQYQYS